MKSQVVHQVGFTKYGVKNIIILSKGRSCNMLGIILLILSIYVIAKGELKISSKSVIKGAPARWLGVYLLFIALGAQYIFLPNDLLIDIPVTIFLIIVPPYIVFKFIYKGEQNQSKEGVK
jgi:hypothetical protein